MDKALESLHKLIYEKYSLSKFLTHPLYTGLKREEIVRKVLCDLMPSIFLIGYGKVLDSKGLSSKHQDVIFYHQRGSIFKFEDIVVYPADTVCGTIEVKSELNKTELKDALENIASVKKLSFIPGKIPHQGNWNEKILCNIFAFDSEDILKIAKDLSELQSELNLNDSEMPDNICILGKYLISKSELFKEHRLKGSQYAFLMLDKNALFMFVDTLIDTMNKPLSSIGIFGYYLAEQAGGRINFKYLDGS